MPWERVVRHDNNLSDAKQKSYEKVVELTQNFDENTEKVLKYQFIATQMTRE